MPRMPLAVNVQSRDGTLAKGSLLTNGFVEGAGEVFEVYKRPGVGLISDAGSAYGSGITSYVNSDTGEEILYAVQDGKIYIAAVPTAGLVWTTNEPLAIATTSQISSYSFGGLYWQLFGDVGGNANVYYRASATSGAWALAKTDAFSVTFGQSKPFTTPGKVWLIGGNIGGSSNDVYNSSNGFDFTLVNAAPPFANFQYGIFVYFQNKIWHLGSGIEGTSWTSVIYNTVDGVTWNTIQATPAFNATARNMYSGFAFRNKLWIVGGQLATEAVGAGARIADVWSSPDGVTWTQESAAPGFTARDNAMVYASSAVVTMIGGTLSGGSGTATIYTSTDGIAWTLVGTSNLSASLWSTGGGDRWQLNLVVHKGVFAITGKSSTVYRYAPVAAGNTVQLATISLDPGEIVDFAQNYLGTEIMLRANGVAYRIDTTLNTAAIISDGDYPARTVKGCVYLNGNFYVMDADGTIYNSAEDNCTSWNGNDFVTAEFEPDGGVCLAKYNQYIAAFGRYTIEFFYDAGNSPGSPLSPVDTSVMLIGCAHGNSVAQIESSLIFAAQRKGSGQSFQKGRFIAMLEGFSFRVLSIPDVDRILDQDSFQTIYSCVESFSGHTFYSITLVTSGITLVFDLTAKLWYRWTRREAATDISVTSLTQASGTATATVSAGHGLSDGDPVTISGAVQTDYNGDFNITYVSSTVFTYPVPVATVSPATGTIVGTVSTEGYWDAISSCNYGGKQVFQEEFGGNIFEIDEDLAEDNSQPIDFRIRTAKWDNGTNKAKFMGWLELIGDKVSSTALIRNTDDDYKTYNNYRRVDMSLQRSALRRLGNFRRRAFEVRHTLDAKVKLEALEFDLEQGY